MRSLWLALGVAVAAAHAWPAAAGETRCATDAQACLNHMVAQLANRGWVGLEMERDDETGVLTVQRVAPGSPAVEAGFEVGDRLVALEGMGFAETGEVELKALYDSMVPGRTVTYSVLRDRQRLSLEVTLVQLPEEVLAQWVGHHMLQHAAVARIQD